MLPSGSGDGSSAASVSSWTTDGASTLGTETEPETGTDDSSASEGSTDGDDDILPPTMDPSCLDGEHTEGELCLDPLRWIPDSLLPRADSAVLAIPIFPSAPGLRGLNADAIMFGQPAGAGMNHDMVMLEASWDVDGARVLDAGNSSIIDRISAVAEIQDDGRLGDAMVGHSPSGVWVFFPDRGPTRAQVFADYDQTLARRDAGLLPFAFMTMSDVPAYRMGAWSWSEGKARLDWTEAYLSTHAGRAVADYIIAAEIMEDDADLWGSGDFGPAPGAELIGLTVDSMLIAEDFWNGPVRSQLDLPRGMRMAEQELLQLVVGQHDDSPTPEISVLSRDRDDDQGLLTLLRFEPFDDGVAGEVAGFEELELPEGVRSMWPGAINADPTLDLVVNHAGDESLSVVIFDRLGMSLRPLALHPSLRAHRVVFGDLNGDHSTDLLLLGPEGEISAIMPSWP